MRNKTINLGDLVFIEKECNLNSMTTFGEKIIGNNSPGYIAS
jgi:hypothetical protein